MDIFMGDRDRHRDQWRWANFGKEKPTLWEPISRGSSSRLTSTRQAVG
jgi:hypothetical protein